MELIVIEVLSAAASGVDGHALVCELLCDLMVAMNVGLVPASRHDRLGTHLRGPVQPEMTLEVRDAPQNPGSMIVCATPDAESSVTR